MLNPDTWKIVTSLIFSDKHLPGLSTEASVFHLKFACHVESTPVQINNMKKHTKKKHLRRASNNKCRMLITSLREEKWHNSASHHLIDLLFVENPWKERNLSDMYMYMEGGFRCIRFTNQEHNTELKSRQYKWQCDCSTAWTQQYPQ